MVKRGDFYINAKHNILRDGTEAVPYDYIYSPLFLLLLASFLWLPLTMELSRSD